MKISLLIRQWRNARNLSQTAAAPIIGVNLRTLQNWECGRNEPRGLARTYLLRLMAGK